ncbi:MAG: NAD(+)/NADH kinase [Anaerovoracaceae bacterium]|jgi:NAD+ kinase
MDKKRIVYIFSKCDEISQKIQEKMCEKLGCAGFTITGEFDPNAELIISIGGDGTFLRLLHQYDFPSVPCVGINTGHLGFFQEIRPDGLDEFIEKYKKGMCTVQRLQTAKLVVWTDQKVVEYTGLNEVVIRRSMEKSIHLDIAIGESCIERFSGDGILVATPSGSTAYNYALGGSIVDPRLSLLQLTPIAPMNTNAYRSFTSSILLPSDMAIQIYPDNKKDDKTLVVTDGIGYDLKNVNKIEVSLSGKEVMLLRLDGYDFWHKVKDKFLQDYRSV